LRLYPFAQEKVVVYRTYKGNKLVAETKSLKELAKLLGEEGMKVRVLRMLEVQDSLLLYITLYIE